MSELVVATYLSKKDLKYLAHRLAADRNEITDTLKDADDADDGAALTTWAKRFNLVTGILRQVEGSLVSLDAIEDDGKKR